MKQIIFILMLSIHLVKGCFKEISIYPWDAACDTSDTLCTEFTSLNELVLNYKDGMVMKELTIC